MIQYGSTANSEILMQDNQIKVSFKGVSQKNRRILLETYRTMGLSEISSVHDSAHDRHCYIFECPQELNNEQDLSMSILVES